MKFENTIGDGIVLYSIVMFLIGFLFLTMGTFIGSVLKNSEKASLYGNLCFLAVFILSMTYDMLEHGGFIKIFAPLKYFLPRDILNGDLDIKYLVFILGLSFILLFRTFIVFKKKDLT